MEGLGSAASSGWLRMPVESTLTATSSASTSTKPISVARPTSARRSARAEYTLAPSMPTNTHTVTSIAPLTCSSTLPSGLPPARPCPQRSRANTSLLKAKTATSTNSASGVSLARVAIWLTNAACRMPRSSKKCMHHTSAEAPATAQGVLPWPNSGR